jgi:hypothetical protein
MDKETKSKSDLATIMMANAQSSGKCGDLETITVLGPLDRPYHNWDFGTFPFVGDECRIELQLIAGKLQQQYDVK